jgi:uncharacterized protein (TIGR00255 family)
MTGYARVRKLDGDAEIVVSVKSVNHRGLDVHFRIPGEVEPFENALRNAVKRKVVRGHIQISVRMANARAGAAASLNRPLLETYLASFRAMAQEHGIAGEPDLNAALRVPGMFATSEEEPNAEMERLLVEALDEALDILNQFRTREGGEISAEMRERNAAVMASARRMEEIRASVLPEFQVRLSERITELLASPGLDPQRLAQEAAFLADRSDISEEITRLKVHAAQLESLLSASGEVGKKLDFLLQEMHRETNTILSKSTAVGEPGMEITDLALGVKAEIEKIREQGLNLE